MHFYLGLFIWFSSLHGIKLASEDEFNIQQRITDFQLSTREDKTQKMKMVEAKISAQFTEAIGFVQIMLRPEEMPNIGLAPSTPSSHVNLGGSQNVNPFRINDGRAVSDRGSRWGSLLTEADQHQHRFVEDNRGGIEQQQENTNDQYQKREPSESRKKLFELRMRLDKIGTKAKANSAESPRQTHFGMRTVAPAAATKKSLKQQQAEKERTLYQWKIVMEFVLLNIEKLFFYADHTRAFDDAERALLGQCLAHAKDACARPLKRYQTIRELLEKAVHHFDAYKLRRRQQQQIDDQQQQQQQNRSGQKEQSDHHSASVTETAAEEQSDDDSHPGTETDQYNSASSSNDREYVASGHNSDLLHNLKASSNESVGSTAKTASSYESVGSTATTASSNDTIGSTATMASSYESVESTAKTASSNESVGSATTMALSNAGSAASTALFNGSVRSAPTTASSSPRHNDNINNKADSDSELTYQRRNNNKHNNDESNNDSKILRKALSDNLILNGLLSDDDNASTTTDDQIEYDSDGFEWGKIEYDSEDEAFL